MKTLKIIRILLLYMLTGIFSVFLLNSTARAADYDHLFWAKDIAENVTPDKNTYATDPSYIYWPDADGVGSYENHTKCASFITQVLMHSYGWTSSDFKDWISTASPTAERYYDTIKLQNGFIAINNIKNIQPGDLIAIKYPDNSSVTGHMMMANGYPLLRSSTSPIIKNTYQYEIEIIDSSQSGHGSHDTRLMEDGTYSPGAGIGVFRLYASSKGVIKGYTWSTYNNSQYYDQNTRPLIVGRLL